MAIENRGPELQAAAYTLLMLALVATAMRCYTRIFMVKNFGFDDWCMTFALITFALFVTCALVGVHYGTGRHHADLEDDDIAEALKYWWFCYIWYCLTMIATKLSIGWFLLRITVRRIDVWIIYGVMLVTIVTGVVFFFVTMFQCTPISYFWNKSQDGFCVPIDVIIALTYLYSVCSVICDFTFAVLPIFVVWTLNINKRTKTALVPILAMACVASAAVLVRFPYVKDFKNPDFLYATVDIAIWSCTEQGLAITAGSLATLRPLLRNFGRCFGLSTPGPTKLEDGDARAASATIGGRSSTKKQHSGPYNLTEIMNDDENPFNEEDQSQSLGTRGYAYSGAGSYAQGSSQSGSDEALGQIGATISGGPERHYKKAHTVTVTAK